MADSIDRSRSSLNYWPDEIWAASHHAPYPTNVIISKPGYFDDPAMHERDWDAKSHKSMLVTIDL